MGIGDPLSVLEIVYPESWATEWAARELQYRWFLKYPRLFDGSDLEIAISQPSAHLGEWSVAIELHARGFDVLVEKYAYANQHPRKHARAAAILGKSAMEWLRTSDRQAPDLLVFNEEGTRFFVEVKRLPDQLREPQNLSFTTFDLVYSIPWIEVRARRGAAYRGLPDEQLARALALIRAGLGSRELPKQQIVNKSEIPEDTRAVHCHIVSPAHPRHALARHERVSETSWRCELCGSLKTRETIVAIIRNRAIEGNQLERRRIPPEGPADRSDVRRSGRDEAGMEASISGSHRPELDSLTKARVELPGASRPLTRRS